MKSTQFDREAKELFGGVLMEYGFSNEPSKYSAFCRKVNEDVFHVILPDPSKGGSLFDVKVFACSPRIEPLFYRRYPDELGIPSDVFCYLSRSGVGIDQEKYNCGSVEVMVRSFKKRVEPLLVKFAIPYLDGQGSLVGMIEYIKNPLYRALALGEVGDPASKMLLQIQLDRLKLLPTQNEVVVSFVNRIEEMLAEL